MKKLFLLLACAFLLGGCGDDDIVTSKEFLIDNPTEKSILVLLDGKSHEIESGQGKVITLKAGKHEISYEGHRVVFVVKPIKSMDTIINPTFSTYILYHEVYQLVDTEDDEREYDRTMKNYLNTYEIGLNETLELPLKPVNSLFIEQGDLQWQFGIDKGYPEESSFDDTQRYSVLSKLFREEDFFDYYGGEEFPIGFRFGPGADSYKTLEPFALFPSDMESGCEQAEPVFREWREKFEKIPSLSGSGKVARACKEVFQGIPYGRKFMELGKTCSNTLNRDLPRNNYDAMLMEGRRNASDLLLRNVYIVE